MKELTPNDANTFFNYLENEYPEINCQLRNYSFVNGSIVCFKPAKMTNEDYDKYNEILKKWLTDNGFM